jgi:hypothetical protein
MGSRIVSFPLHYDKVCDACKEPLGQNDVHHVLVTDDFCVTSILSYCRVCWFYNSDVISQHTGLK